MTRTACQPVWLVAGMQVLGGGNLLYQNRKTTEYTELQRLISGVHSIMKVKLAQAGEGGGCTPTPFHYIGHHQ